MDKKFSYKTKDEFLAGMKEFGIELPFSENIDILAEGMELNGKKIANRLAIHPMEGCDCESDGKPSNLTKRRYLRFAQSGAGLVWYEACAVTEEGKANPRQLLINEENKGAIKELLDMSNEESSRLYGSTFKPYSVLQLTHSGRYSKPGSVGEPIVAVRNPYLDKDGLNYKIISDEELEILEDKYVVAATLAKEIGFDAVDIKSCHRYLISELLSAHTREGNYGGSFENRTKFLLNIIDKIREKLGNSIEITLRLNVYDSINFPYGWGVAKEGLAVDLEEPKKLIKLLEDRGIKIINISIGNPYYNPHVGRPYDMGGYESPNHPIEGVNKILNIMKMIQNEFPEMIVIGTGLSWLREYSPNISAGAIEKGWFKIAGFGRMAFAYPEFAKDILETGKLEKNKCCIACSKCSAIMRMGGKSGCVIKDTEIYAKEFQTLLKASN